MANEDNKASNDATLVGLSRKSTGATNCTFGRENNKIGDAIEIIFGRDDRLK